MLSGTTGKMIGKVISLLCIAGCFAQIRLLACLWRSTPSKICKILLASVFVLISIQHDTFIIASVVKMQLVYKFFTVV